MDKENNRILSGTAGDWFLRTLVKHNISPTNAYITTVNNLNYDKLNTSKCIFTLGQEALNIFKTEDDAVTLNEQRGSPFRYNNIPVISSYAPQDTHDLKNYEQKFNNTDTAGNVIYEDDSDTENEKDTGKAHGKTKRKNFKFWLTRDIVKVSRILAEGLLQHPADLIIYPSADEIIYELTTNKDKDFFWDIETDPDTNDITVFSFSFQEKNNISSPKIYVVPCRRYSYTRAYDNLPKIFVSLAVALRDNVTITHNGSTFDLFMFTRKYRLPFGIHNFDTMVSHHRNYPEVEKSLGHVISLYTDQPYHKNTSGTFCPWNTKQEMQLWTYNGIDVQSMIYVKAGILKHAARIKALESIEQANRSIAPYLTLTFTGIRFDNIAAQKHISLNDRRCNVLLKILWKLVGRILNPRSNKAMPHYLYAKKDKGGLGLTPPSYSKDTGNPKCDAKAIIKLYVKHPEIVSLPVIIQIRRTQKESEALKFTPIDW